MAVNGRTLTLREFRSVPLDEAQRPAYEQSWRLLLPQFEKEAKERKVEGGKRGGQTAYLRFYPAGVLKIEANPENTAGPRKQ